MPRVKAGARERIQEAAVELMGRKGVAGTTTQDIARRARCSQAVIYKYWESKEALAREEFA
jgi:AcrR family transcriptional regulator